MSDDDRDNDIESDADKRAHHNALERKRRDHIKDSFSSLRDALPCMAGEKASRAQILKRAAEYIQQMRRKNSAHQQDIEDLRRQNKMLEDQIRSLEKAKATGNYAAAVLEASHYNTKGEAMSAFDGTSESESSDTERSKDSQRKKMKANPSDGPMRT